jgi:hypothetical protein
VLTSDATPSDHPCMTLLSEPTTGGRHRAPEPDDGELRIAMPEDLLRTGRHADDWARPQFDPGVDEDPFDWLGVATRRA